MKYGKIKTLLSVNHIKQLRSYFFQSLALNFLDLLSLAYLIPIIALLLDKNKFQSLLEHYGIDFISLDKPFIVISLLFLFLFYVIKNILQIRYNKRFIHYLYNLSNEIAIKNVQVYLSQGHLHHQTQDKGNVFSLVIKVSKDFCCRFLQPFVYLLSELFFLLIITSFLLFFYFKFTLLLIAILSVFFLIIYWTKQSQMQLINTTYKESLALANSELMNILDGYLEIKSSNNESFFLKRFYQRLEKLNEVTALLESSTVNYSKYLELCMIASLGGLAYITLSSKTNDLVLISTFAALGFRFIPSLSRILGALTKIRSHSFSIDVLHHQFTLLNQQQKTSINDFHQTIRMENVSFSYDGQTNILSDISFHLNAGDFVTINGISGVGKTTFLHLLMGLLSPSNGHVFLDQEKIQQYQLFSFLNYIPQQPYLFSGTLLNNITMGTSLEADDFLHIKQLCRIFQLQEVIDKLPEKYHTYLQHNSTRLSGGQKQRLALVRVLYKQPKILILDEATNQQDEEMEHLIFSYLQKLSQQEKMAIISVSHNTQLNAYATQTYVINNQTVSSTSTY